MRSSSSLVVALVAAGSMSIVERSILRSIREICGEENVKICEGIPRAKSVLVSPPSYVVVYYDGTNEDHVEDVLSLYSKGETTSLLVVDGDHLQREVEQQRFHHDHLLLISRGGVRFSADLKTAFGFRRSKARNVLDVTALRHGARAMIAERGAQPTAITSDLLERGQEELSERAQYRLTAAIQAAREQDPAVH